LSDKHSKKNGTPTMGGLIFIIPTLVTSLILLFMDKIEFTDNLLIVMFVFVAYAILGFIDDYLIVKRKNNIGLTEIQKLFGQLFIAVIFFYIFTKSGLDPVLDIHTLGIKIDMGWFYGVFLLIVLIGSSNAVNLTDGLDGLAGGLSAIAFLAFGMISWGAVWTSGNTDIAIFSFILAGSLLGFLFYNTHPAKVFMGDTGSLALGGTMAAIAILTKYEVTLVIIAGVFVIETLSSIIQMIAGRYFGKKIFLMAPLHHHFEKLGWEERDIVKTFWVVGLVLAMLGIMFAVWI
jgi:phospho-N-acetylmuramoyl-pentapeptide-transferase